ncbi:MAG: YitT family protein [Alistipes sp.]|jgi:uncharacterized membrane-anchored protein YitT (DUF2179 family)|nr:YitT family protein [Alistipes sp.]
MIKNLNIGRLNVGRLIKEYGLIHLGCMLYAFTWASIVQSANGIGGGASGLALLLQYATGIPMGITYVIINGVLVTLALLIVGRHFGIKSIWGIASIALWLNIFTAILPPDLLGLGDDKLLSAILAGALSGIGVGVCFLQGGSTGGTDIVAMIINKFRRVSYGRVVMVSDFAIIGSSWFVYHARPDVDNPLAMIIYGYVIVAVFSWTVDTILAGNKQSSQIFIFSRHYDDIARDINHRLHRGVTILDGVGAYTGQASKMLVVLCRKQETSNILRVVREHDPDAFVSVGSVMGVYGKGFEEIEVGKKKVKNEE